MGKLAGCGALASTLLLLFSSQRLAADDSAYFINPAGLFGTIDLNTGAFTMLGNSAIPNYKIIGLGSLDGKLYTAPFTGSALYSVNPSTGALTFIGNSPIQYWGLGSTTTGLYALSLVNGTFSLYSVNPATAATKLVGSLGMGLGQFYAWSLSNGSSTLYFADLESLYSVNTNTGAATLAGATDLIPGALVFEDNKLYAGVNSCATTCKVSVWTLNPAAGTGSFVANANTSTTGTGGSPTDFAGLAPTVVTSPPPENGHTYVIAHFPFGGGWNSRVAIGAASTGATVNVNFFSQTGSTATVPLDGPGNQTSQQFRLAPNTVQIMSADPTERNAVPLDVTWALAESNTPLNIFTLFDYAPSPFFTRSPATQIQGSVGAQSFAPAASFHFPVSVSGPLNFNAGLAIANPNNSSAAYSLLLLNADGTQRGAVQRPALPPFGQSIFLITDVFNAGTIPQNASSPFNGSVVVCAGEPVGLVAIGVEGNAFFTISSTNDYPCP